MIPREIWYFLLKAITIETVYLKVYKYILAIACQKVFVYIHANSFKLSGNDLTFI